MNDGTVKVRSQVKYGRKFNYPENRAAELFCQLTRTPGQTVAKSLTDWQLDIIRELGHEVEATTEIVRRNRKKMDENAAPRRYRKTKDSDKPAVEADTLHTAFFGKASTNQ